MRLCERPVGLILSVLSTLSGCYAAESATDDTAELQIAELNAAQPTNLLDVANDLAAPMQATDVIYGQAVVNGVPVANSVRLVLDSESGHLPALAEGAYQVEARQVWLLSSHHSRSFDSRYFGPVSIDAIIGQAKR